MLTDRRGNALLVAVVVLGAVVALASTLGFLLVEGGPTAAAEDPATPRDVEVLYEQWDDRIYVAVNGGSDAGNVTSYSVSGASLNGTLDPDADYPEVRGTVDLPTTVTVTATFEDGTTVVVAEWYIE